MYISKGNLPDGVNGNGGQNGKIQEVKIQIVSDRFLVRFAI